MMPRHVLHICEAFLPEIRGGAGRAAADLIHALADAGCRVDAICPAFDGKPGRWTPREGVRVFAVPAVAGSPMPPRAARRLFDALGRHIDFAHIDLLHDNGGFFPALWPLERRIRESIPGPFLAQFQIQWRPLLTVEGFSGADIEARAATQRELAALADHVIFLSNDEREEGLRHLGVSADACSVLPNPIVPERYDGLRRPPAGSEPVIGLGGRLDAPSKGADLALDALAALAARHAFRVRLVGNAPSAVRLPAALNARVTSTGWLDAAATAQALAGLDLFLMPSRYEPFGLLAAEALAAGVSVIVSDTGGLRDMVTHGKHGAKVPIEAGADGWEHAVEDWFSAREACRAWAEAGRAHVLRQYAAPRVAALTLDLYDRICAAGRMPAV